MVRRVYLTAILVLMSTVCYAQHDAVYSIKDFSKMLYSQASPYIIPQNAAKQARNVRSNDIQGSLAKRSTMMLYGSLGDYPVTSLHRYYKSDSTDYLVGTGSTFILLGDDDGGDETILMDQLTSGLRWSWVTYKDNAIGCNGTDRCHKWDGDSTTTANTDGSRTASMVTAELGAPYAELNTGANLDASSWYQYKMQYTDGSTTWYSTAVSNPILTGAAVRDITLTDIPLGPSGTTARYLYRTGGQATRAALSSATFYLAVTVGDNSTTTANDTTDDATLVGETEWAIVGKSNLTPPIVKYITIHKERLFGANAPDLNSYIYWSYSFKPNIFSASDYDFVRIDDGDDITFIKGLLGKLVIGKTNTITNFETQNTDDTKWQFYTYSFVGCPAPYSVASTPIGIIYLGWDGIYRYNGQSSEMISDVVTKDIRDILQSNLSNVVGVYFQNEYSLSYASESSGATVNNTVLVYDLIRDAYVIDDKSINCFAVFNSGNDFGTLYSGTSGDDGKVLAHNPALSTLIFRYKSDFDAGTKDSLVVGGIENSPILELGWGITIDSLTMAGVTLDSVTYDSATIDRNSTTGYWWSANYPVSASDYEKFYWNETLGGYGDITFAIRSAATSDEASADSLAWSDEFTDPAGSDLSDETANDYLQIRSTFTTSDINYTPYLTTLNNFTAYLIYSRVGASAETTINSIWESGYTDLGQPTAPKRIWGINVKYTGTSGTMTVGLRNERGDIDTSFDIDLSVGPDDSTTDQYFGTSKYKIYKWLAPVNSEDDPSPIGRSWIFTVEEDGSTEWNVYEIQVKISQEEFYED